MTRNDCMWVAVRCTGLVLLIVAAVTLPSLLTTWEMFHASGMHTLTEDVAGMGQISQSMASAGKIAFRQAGTQVLLTAGLSAYFLSGAPGLWRWLVRGL